MAAKFPCLIIEGGLIGLDLIDQIAEGKAPGQKPADFGLDSKYHLVDEIASVWSDARAYWEAFLHRLERISSDDPATSVTRDQWMIPFFGLLGYELVYTPRAEIVEGQTYAISHRAGSNGNAPPIHIVGCRQSLDKRPESGRPRLAPHSLLQEYLNRTEHLWGIVTNGFTLRLLRDSQLIRRQAYIEFDLKQMMEGEKFSDFSLLYRLIHRSRLPRSIEDASDCLLEQYYRLTLEQGGRVRDRLRDGVEEALKIFANGFLSHPRNEDLRIKVQKGEVSALKFYRQLLRLIYRFLFLMVAEERNLITENQVYRDYYSISRLRRLVEERSAYTDYEDLWLGVKTTFRLFQDENIGNVLEIPLLNGDLFDPSQTEDLEELFLTNSDFLKALWHLSMYREDNRSPWRRINYSALDVEELGSVYESLLDFQPVFRDLDGRPSFELSYGTERKSTGSYYTPPELVNELIKSALIPVLEEKLKSAKSPEEKEQAILKLKVCDPACGSGHFLLAAARTLGKELAKIRTGDDEPSPEQTRLAIRDVITHCIYGVDKNPLAVDLCKVALWIEGHTKGKPLTFLDHRIRLGDSLIGVLDLKVLQEGIPDEAFEPVSGDNRAIARSIKQQNRGERRGQLSFDFNGSQEISKILDSYQDLVWLSDDGPENVRKKAEAYKKVHSEGTNWWKDNTACDLWTSSFFIELTDENNRNHSIPTTDVLYRFLQSGSIDGKLVRIARNLAEYYRFFHWPVEFPEVFAEGGFDVVIGNPPFMGGLKISGTLGDKYRHFLTICYKPFSGTADLCAAFYRRAFSLLRLGGRMGMVATNTIGQGDTRESGLAVILAQGGAITFARRFIKWPGAANVEVNLVAIYKPDRSSPAPRHSPILDSEPADFISSRLDTEPEAEPKRLPQNEGKAFIGDTVVGIGFVLEPKEAEALLVKDPRNTDCLFPYLNGEDLNSDPQQKPSRWVICFHDWDLEKARQYPELLKIAEDRVRPHRESLRETISTHKKRKKYWWQFGAYAKELRRAIAPLRRVLVRSRVSELHALTFVPKGYVYGDATVVFAFDDDYHFALLQSSVHEVWLRKQASSLRTDVRYTPTDCFDTFPFPPEEYRRVTSGEWRVGTLPKPFAEAARIGAEYHEHRRQIMLAQNFGLTTTYNLFHDPNCIDPDIKRLRELHAEMDRSILACYKWEDLDPKHGFYPNERGQIRYTVSPEARREILKRLLELNLSITTRGGI